MEESVKYSLVEGIAIITLNRPGAYNAFGSELVTRLAHELMGISTNPEVRGVILTGAGKAFCAGGDLKWLTSYEGTYGQAFHSLAAVFHQAVLEIRRMPKPVIAAINGIAAGGGFSMALACDFRVMERSAIMRQGYTTNGLSLDGGGTFTLPRLVGLARAMEIAAFDQPIPPDQALAWGLVTEVVEDGRSVQRSMELIQAIRKGSPFSFAASKSLMTDSFHTPFESQLEKERNRLSSCADHPNGREGIAAFLEKRKPVYP
jgi:2-(1,2-epoxy-1,2-dihydrophenyl)acetyl-CoA isomerase